MGRTSLGEYLAYRLDSIGLSDYFAIPGDFNLALLDELNKSAGLRMVTCCNELNAGYAADGYARARGAAALVVTYAVGGLSALNAVAGAYAENLPVLVISGGPNVRSVLDRRILHHSLARPEEGAREVQRVFGPVTAQAVIVRDPDSAPRRIDQAIAVALRERKPVYLEIACDLARLPVSAPHPLDLYPRGTSQPEALAAAVEHAAAFLKAARQPVLVAGGRLRSAGAPGAFAALAAACGYGVACMPDAKGLYPESDPQFMGIYWGNASSAGCREVVESSDAYLFAGPVFSDYTTVGFSTLIRPGKLLEAAPGHIRLEGQSYQGVLLPEFLGALAARLEPNRASREAFQRVREACPQPPAADPRTPLTTRRLYQQIGRLLTPETTLLAETGDSWFNAMELQLPEGARFEIQMQYGSIGWSVGAFLGLAVASPERRVLGLIGDGSFQMAAQELSSLLRHGCRGTLFLLNNGGYSIEVMIHDGPYNTIQGWDYARLAEALQDRAAPSPQVLARTVRTEAELAAALEAAEGFPGLVFLEAVLDRYDCNKALLGWGTAVADFNAGR